ncbi:MAG: hypothetical protein ACR2HN_10010 [Tepidiformaceae bacterium]
MPANTPGRIRLPRFFRGLALGLTLSVVNLLGGFLTIVALGGLGEWSGTQFVGMFGVLEIATGFAFIIGPNAWRLPVAEANTSDRTKVRLAASTLFIPHWAGGAKCVAGAAMLGFAAIQEGLGLASVGLVLAAALVVLGALALSLLVARWGVAHPGVDVVELVIRRPGRKDVALPALSIGAAIMQLLLNIGIFPAVKFLPPAVLYRPHIAPSASLLAWMAVVTALLLAAAALAWRGRIAWQAPREQQREAEEFARA